MRRLVESNYSLDYSRFALDANYLRLVHLPKDKNLDNPNLGRYLHL